VPVELPPCGLDRHAGEGIAALAGEHRRRLGRAHREQVRAVGGPARAVALGGEDVGLLGLAGLDLVDDRGQRLGALGVLGGELPPLLAVRRVEAQAWMALDARANVLPLPPIARVQGRQLAHKLAGIGVGPGRNQRRPQAHVLRRAVAPAPDVHVQGQRRDAIGAEQLGKVAACKACHLAVEDHQLRAVARLRGQAPLGGRAAGLDLQARRRRQVGRDGGGDARVVGSAAAHGDEALGVRGELAALGGPVAAFGLLTGPVGVERGGVAGGGAHGDQDDDCTAHKERTSAGSG